MSAGDESASVGAPPTGELLRLSPLADARAAARVDRIRQHPHAPRWTWEAGDRLERADLDAVLAWGEALRTERARGAQAGEGGAPAEAILRWVRDLRDRVALFRERLPEGIDLGRAWSSIETSSREDVARAPERLVPEDAELPRMIVYRTSGTTGHALLVPHDVRAAAAYLPMIDVALARWGARAPSGDDEVGAINVGAQRRTVTYACTLAAWGHAGFAKLNLHPGDWREPEDPARFLGELAPRILTGDPLSFTELSRTGTDLRPSALITTAVALSGAVRERLRARFACPVIDWYSLTETGPIGFACPAGGGYHLLPHDVFVEALDPRGAPAAPGERGEIAITGGRNPFLPLLRYRTGDHGRIDGAPCGCGDPAPRIVELEGRAPVVMRAEDGSFVNTVDVSRALREFPLLQHELVQRADRSLSLSVRTIDGPGALDGDALAAALEGLFGRVGIDVRADETLGEKVVPYKSELPLEE